MRAGCDGKGVPLVVADFWAVEEQPLAWLVLHAGFGELDLHGVCMFLAYCAYFSEETYRMGGGRP